MGIERDIDPATLAYHEIRSPLGLIVTSARLAAEDATDAVVRERCAAIERTGERLLRIVALAFALERTPVERGRFRPWATVEAVVEDSRALGASIRLAMKPGAVAAEAAGPAAHFEMLIQALIANALDHGEPGCQVLVSACAGDETFEVTVANRVAKHSGHEGLGLGAYVVGRLTTVLGATLEESRRGCLHRVHLRLPLAEALAEARPAAAPRRLRAPKLPASALSR